MSGCRSQIIRTINEAVVYTNHKRKSIDVTLRAEGLIFLGFSFSFFLRGHIHLAQHCFFGSEGASPNWFYYRKGNVIYCRFFVDGKISSSWMHSQRSCVVVLGIFFHFFHDKTTFDNDSPSLVWDLIVIDIFWREWPFNLFEF